LKGTHDPNKPQENSGRHSVRSDAPLHEVEDQSRAGPLAGAHLGLKYGGNYDPAQHHGREHYLLPTQTWWVLPPPQLGVKAGGGFVGRFVEHDSSAPKPSVTVCATI
jgi:hypothetical protein